MPAVLKKDLLRTDNSKKKDIPVSSIQFIASAGTGKTHQVTGLYTALILGRPYPLEGHRGKP